MVERTERLKTDLAELDRIIYHLRKPEKEIIDVLRYFANLPLMSELGTMQDPNIRNDIKAIHRGIRHEAFWTRIQTLITRNYIRGEG
jgi:hypothetical protein